MLGNLLSDWSLASPAFPEEGPAMALMRLCFIGSILEDRGLKFEGIE